MGVDSCEEIITVILKTLLFARCVFLATGTVRSAGRCRKGHSYHRNNLESLAEIWSSFWNDDSFISFLTYICNMHFSVFLFCYRLLVSISFVLWQQRLYIFWLSSLVSSFDIFIYIRSYCVCFHWESCALCSFHHNKT